MKTIENRRCDITVRPRIKKGRALNRSTFGCLQGGHSLNITWGCSFSCVYCYARGYSRAPHAGVVDVYTNLPQLLEKEIHSPRRKYPLQVVYVNTSSDCFQPHPDVLDAAYRVMEILLCAGIQVSFLTKGKIPARFLRLFQKYPHLVTARIGLVSVDQDYVSAFEPGTTGVQDRLSNLLLLREAGLEPSVRVDPVIPMLTDTRDSINKLLDALYEAEVKEATVSYLHVRPGIWPQLKAELPALNVKLLQALFSASGWKQVGGTSKSQLLPAKIRQTGYRRFQEAARDRGIRALICACKNPDLQETQSCHATTIRLNSPSGEKQLELFNNGNNASL